VADEEVRAVLSRAAAALDIGLAEAGLEALEAYGALVGRWQHVTNLTGARDAAQFAREHVVDCLALAPHLTAGRVLDVGSGAGLPGIVIAIARPDLALTLLEPRARRARFLTQVAIELALPNVEVVCARAETYRGTDIYDYVVSRAFGSLAAFVAAVLPQCSPQTTLIAMKAAIDAADLMAAEQLVGPAAVVRLEVPGFANRHLVRFAAER
jgi:16S rRNA (guanine527-N7)-methyltransferase